MSLKFRERDFKRLMNSKFERAAHKIGAHLVKETQRLMKPGTSSPGQPPGVHTGDYRRSIKYKVEKTRHGPHVVVGSTAGKLSVYLELGTRYMAPRPHFRPALERSRTAIKRIIKEECRV